MKTKGYYNKAQAELERGELLCECALMVFEGTADIDDLRRLHSLKDWEVVAILSMAD